MNPLLLDLFCGGGGAAAGYARAGFDVLGVDINRQPNYPFTFYRGDAIEVMEHLLGGGSVEGGTLSTIRAIHASPPCQAYTRKAANWGRERTTVIEHPDLVGITRERLEASGLPFVIENVPGAPVRSDLELCGTMFGLRIIRHRLFESNAPLGHAPAGCDHSDVYNPWQGAGRSAAKFRAAMGIDWLPSSGGASRAKGYTGDISNAIPPAYTEHVGAQLIKSL